MAATLGWTHDFGKLTEWFQANFDERSTTVGKPEQYTYHSLLGAVLAHYALDRRGYSETTCSVGFHAAVAHHRATADIQNETDRYAADRPPVNNRLDRVGEQVDNVRSRIPAYAERIVRTASGGGGSLADFEEYLDERLFAYDLGRVERRPPDTAYGTLVLLTGALKLADRSIVLEREFRPHTRTPTEQISPGLERELPSPGVVETAIDELGGGGQTSELDRIRTSVQRQVRDRAVNQCEDSGGGFLGTIQLPTGFGKTHAGVWAGLELATAAAEGDHADGRTLAYVLPYTSIVDQTADTIRDVYRRAGRADSLLVDHYLEQTRIDIDAQLVAEEEDDDGDVPAEFFLGRSWRANTVLSTFVQLFESLAGPTSNQAPKLPSLQESVVVIDEPQLLDVQWWPVVGRLADVLVDQFDAVVLSMTATQPRIFDEEAENEVHRLVEHRDGPLGFLADNPRVEYTVHPSVDGVDPDSQATTVRDRDESASSTDENDSSGRASGGVLSHSGAAELLVDDTSEGETALAVCNTIDSARCLDTAITDALHVRDGSVVSLGVCLHEWVTDNECYPDDFADPERSEFEARVAERVAEPDTVLVVHLSAVVRPPDRLRLIRFLRESDVVEETCVICTATQVVEAGVDLSFDRVYRDLAPVPSLVQSGGRCNRSLESASPSTVSVWRLEAPPAARSERPPSEVIYAIDGDRLVPTVRSVPYDYADRTVEETTMIGPVVEEFYERIHGGDPGDRSLVDAVDSAASQTLRSASLIENRDDRVEVLFARIPEEIELMNRLRSAVENEAWDTVQRLFGEAQQLQFSVSRRRLGEILDTPASERVSVYDSPVFLVDGTEIPAGFDPHLGIVDGADPE